MLILMQTPNRKLLKNLGYEDISDCGVRMECLALSAEGFVGIAPGIRIPTAMTGRGMMRTMWDRYPYPRGRMTRPPSPDWGGWGDGNAKYDEDEKKIILCPFLEHGEIQF